MSKSARKREYLAAQALGERLIELKAEQLDAMPIDGVLRDAIDEAATISSRSALRRQRQLVGKLMARADTAAIREAYDALMQTDRARKAVFRDAERWRDRILQEGSRGVAAFVAATGADAAGLEAEVREFAQSHDDRARRRATRAIFREIHRQLDAGMQNRRS